MGKFQLRWFINLSLILVFQIGFEFVPSELNIVESFWRFIIPERNISIPFLLVGETREPDVSLDRSHLNFKALLVGKSVYC